jgi:hypothetical protein
MKIEAKAALPSARERRQRKLIDAMVDIVTAVAGQPKLPVLSAPDLNVAERWPS